MLRRMLVLVILLPVIAVLIAPRVTKASSSNIETRAEFVFNLVSTLGLTPSFPSIPDFTDVPPSNLYYAAIEAAYKAGWVSGVGNGKFDLYGPLTRAAVAKIEVLALGDGAQAAGLANQPSGFEDAASIPSWAVGYVNEAVALGILKGEPGDVFNPNGELTANDEQYAVRQLIDYRDSEFGITALSASVPSQVTAGSPFAASLATTGGTRYSGYDTLLVTTGTFDSHAVLPTSATYSGGLASVDVVLTRAGVNTLTVDDVTLGLSTTLNVNIQPGAPSSVSVGVPATAQAGSPFTATLSLKDAWGNLADYSGPVPVFFDVTGDSGAQAPTEADFVNGVATVQITPSVAGSPALMVSLSVGGQTVTGTSAAIDVSAPSTTVSIAQPYLYAGGPLEASIPVSSQDDAWSLVAPNGYTFPLFGSTSSSISQTLPTDMVEDPYTLEAVDNSTGITYTAQVSVSSTYQFSLGTVTPSLVWNTQDMIPVYDAGYDGQGEKIALYEVSGFLYSDIEQFDREYGLPNPNITVYGPNGQSQPIDYTAGSGMEAALDIEWAHAMAPLAKIVVYEEPNNVFNMAAVASDAQSRGFNALSFSFCYTGDDPTGGLMDQEFDSAASSGLAVFAASGDNGEEFPGSSCWPSSNPDVVSVGGIEYTYGGSSYWDSGYDPNSGSIEAGGWGASDYYAASWQSALGYGQERILPDVSQLADNAVLVFNGQDGLGMGTSFASPEWAGIWSLADEAYRAQYGTGIPGDAADEIYRIAQDVNSNSEPAFFQQQGTAATFYRGIGFGAPDVAAFVHDVMTGP